MSAIEAENRSWLLIAGFLVKIMQSLSQQLERKWFQTRAEVGLSYHNV